jgi:hypothetical protein
MCEACADTSCFSPVGGLMKLLLILFIIQTIVIALMSQNIKLLHRRVSRLEKKEKDDDGRV